MSKPVIQEERFKDKEMFYLKSLTGTTVTLKLRASVLTGITVREHLEPYVIKWHIKVYL